VFGISFTELLLVGVVALMVVGPSKLPKMLGTLGTWLGKLRRISQEMRQQTGIDEMLRAEGLQGGLSELRSLVRGATPLGRAASVASGLSAMTKERPAGAKAGAAARLQGPSAPQDPYEGVESDFSREYPVEGCDAAGALPDDLWLSGDENLEPELDDSPGAIETAEPPKDAPQREDGAAGPASELPHGAPSEPIAPSAVQSESTAEQLGPNPSVEPESPMTPPAGATAETTVNVERPELAATPSPEAAPAVQAPGEISVDTPGATTLSQMPSAVDGAASPPRPMPPTSAMAQPAVESYPPRKPEEPQPKPNGT
jgi:sec-independent protein translocase protein TatB